MYALGTSEPYAIDSEVVNLLTIRKLTHVRRTATAIALASSIALGTLGTAAPASAAVRSPKSFDRKDVIKRAKSWTKRRVPYSQVGYRNGYRRDCSGFLSMAWGLPENLVTWRVPTVAKRIPKRALKPGDVLLNVRGSRHVVIFEKWANKRRTKYWVLEQTGQSGVDSAIRRKVPYPYRYQGSMYKPYRYVGMKGFYKAIPKGDRQPVRNRATIRKMKAQENRRAEWRRTAKLRREAREERRERAIAREKAAKREERRAAAKAAETTSSTVQGDARTVAPRAGEPKRATGAVPANPMMMLFQQLGQWMSGR